jgi:hypothetical protein
MASTDIALVNASYNKVNTGRDANSDSWMVYARALASLAKEC